jgi:hypothetical protein
LPVSALDAPASHGGRFLEVKHIQRRFAQLFAAM